MTHSYTLGSPLHIAQQLRRIGNTDTQLCQDSRQLKIGDIFVAFSGDTHDGRHHISAALKSGACAVLAEAEDLATFLTPDIVPNQVIAVSHLKQALGGIADAFYNHPSQLLDTVAITGTNGKTTVVNYLAQLLEQLQQKRCAVLGTLGAGLYGKALSTGLTTPHASQVHTVLAHAVKAGAGSAAIEATSIGLQEGRLNGVAIDVAALTNFTQDHLDYHGTMAAYAAAKRSLFDWASLKVAVINIDDALGVDLLGSLQIERPTLWLITTGLTTTADLYASDITVLANGMQSFILHYRQQQYAITVPLLGVFNISNILTVLACLLALNYDLALAIRLLPHLKGTPGRMEIVKTADLKTPLVLVDYAHTPDGLLKALQALQPIAHKRSGKLHLIFGCGGNRDATKRPLMGAIAHQYSDYVCITSDNPRDEAPETIAADIAVRVPDAVIELDRSQAIKQVITQANINDVILIAGKGHETTQIIKGQNFLFSDISCAKQVLSTLNN
jgi:UDP-N-acetylmuramoyl-L-alanyl-D-glutamate--2,6-diaminopimelate ligase